MDRHGPRSRLPSPVAGGPALQPGRGQRCCLPFSLSAVWCVCLGSHILPMQEALAPMTSVNCLPYPRIISQQGQHTVWGRERGGKGEATVPFAQLTSCPSCKP